MSWRVGVLALCLVAATACVQPDETVTQSTPAPRPTGDAPATADENERASAGLPPGLSFTADLIGGGQLEGGDLQGRDVVLWFWAPW